MATAADLVRRSMKLLGVLAAGESVRAEDEADCLEALNALLGTWDNERLHVPGLVRAEVPVLANTSPLIMGPAASGGEVFTFEDPYFHIEQAGFKASASARETPVRILTTAEYAAIPDKAATGSVVTSIWLERGGGNTYSIHLWPVPTSAAYLPIYAWAKISSLTLAASTVLDFPTGYENAMAHALALQVAPMFGVEPGGTLLRNAEEAMRSIRSGNFKPGLLVSDFPTGGSFNIVTGGS